MSKRFDSKKTFNCGCILASSDGAIFMQPCSSECPNYKFAIKKTQSENIPSLDLRPKQLATRPSCPHCGHMLDGYISADADNHPEPGACTICAKCFKFSVFTETDLRTPTPEEQQEFDNDADLQATLAGVRKMFAWKNK